MSHFATRRSVAFPPVRRGTRLLAAALGCVMGLGLTMVVVHGMAQQSDGMALGDFVASHLVAEQPVVAAAPAERQPG